MRTRTFRSSPRRGLTLVEALIASTFLGALFLTMAQASARAADAFDAGSAEHQLATTTQTCVERIARRIEFADAGILAGQVTTALGDDQVAFATPASLEGGAVTWTDVEILTELEPGELDNGVDDNDNGLTDERRIVLVEDAGSPDERRLILARGVPGLLAGEEANNQDDNGNGLVDETGLSFAAQGETMFVRLTRQRLDKHGRILTKTAETAVRLRNN